MKKFAVLFICAILLNACKKEIPEPPTESTSNTQGWGNVSYNVYHVTFFTTSNSGSGPIGVSCGGGTGIITYYYNYNPGCNATGCANFDVPPGTYPWGASAGSSFYRSGQFTTGSAQCITIHL